MERVTGQLLQIQRMMFRAMRPLIMAARNLMRQTRTVCDMKQGHGEAEHCEETAAMDNHAFGMIANEAVAMSLEYRGGRRGGAISGGVGVMDR